MQLKHLINQGVCTIHFIGDFDAEGVQSCREELEKLCTTESIKSLLVNLYQVEFLDSSGVGALVYAFKRMSARNASMRIEGVRGQPASLMRLLRMDQAMNIQWASDTGQDAAVGAGA